MLDIIDFFGNGDDPPEAKTLGSVLRLVVDLVGPFNDGTTAVNAIPCLEI